MKNKYNLKRNEYKTEELACTMELSEKWDYIRAKGGWYGISLGSVPASWIIILDEFLSWGLEKCPELRIQQIKIKFGGMRIYLEGLNNEVYDMKTKLEEVFYDKRLVY